MECPEEASVCFKVVLLPNAGYSELRGSQVSCDYNGLIINIRLCEQTSVLAFYYQQ